VVLNGHPLTAADVKSNAFLRNVPINQTSDAPRPRQQLPDAGPR
jgi:hypothetical protein